MIKKKLNSIWNFIKRKKIWTIPLFGVILLTLIVTVVSGEGKLEVARAERGDLVRSVKISGKVTSREKVDLGFEVGGTVSQVNKSVGSQVSRGEVLVRLNSGALYADVQKAQAELSSAQAELAKIQGTEVYENDLTNDKRQVILAIQEAYTAASDAVQNKTDQFYLHPFTDTPQIGGNFDGYNDLRDSVETDRVRMGYFLADWEKMMVTINSSNTYTKSQLDLSKKYLDEVATFISNVSRAVNMFKETSYMSQTRIDQYKADMLSARSSLSAASQKFITAENGLSATLSTVPVQLSRVEAARANLLNLQFQLSRMTLTSPISGVVARQDAKLGQAVTAGTQLVSVISPDYIVETYVPEVSIAGIMINNSAKITLDAYGTKEIFEANVDQIDPAETIRDGVSTYKVTLHFITPSERIRSGMTANVEIETYRQPSALLIPDRSVVRDGDQAFVYLVDGENELRVNVTLGEKDSKGNIEVLTGLSDQDEIVLNPED